MFLNNFVDVTPASAPASAPAPTTFVRLVHFSFYFLSDTMPDDISRHIQNVRNDNPGWAVKVWGPLESRQLVADRYSEFLRMYDDFPYAIQRSDFSRYAFLHAFGGVYMDVDYRLKRPLSAIVEFLDTTPKYAEARSFVVESPNRVILRRTSNSLMMSRWPGHSFWIHAMRSVNNGQGLTKAAIVLSSTGPQALDRALATLPNNGNLYRAKVAVLDVGHFNPCGICSRGNACKRGKGVLAVHTNAGTWHGSDWNYNNAYCSLGWIVAVFILCIVLIISVVLACVYGLKASRQQKHM